MGFALFKRQPTSEQVCQFIGRVINVVGIAPKNLVTDAGAQFTSAGFKDWCRRRNIRQRIGAVGKQGSIAVVERFIRSLKSGCTRVLAVVPLLRHSMQRELRLYVDWFNQDRPHSRLAGATPAEMYYGRRPACRAPRLEPCAAWPRASPCARPQTLIKGQPGVRLQLKVQFVAARRHLPRIELICAA
jgi:transposase InsO family protein